MGINEDREMLISKLQGEGYLKSDKVILAFREVPREEFVLASDRVYSYSDYPLQIGHGQTISAPHMVAMMTELLKPKESDNVLEIGAGSGYQAAILSRLVSRVLTVEVEPDLAVFAKGNLDKAGCTNVDVLVGDGSKGHPPRAPYDKIIVTCAAPDILQAWKDQLKEGGILIAPVGGFYHQDLILLRKSKDGFKRESHGGVIFVPLRPG
ncbi:MAG: protein-L-isoaspartate(D-aspartate) O-methyltransferase [Candidatus Aenigmarchaeota archaeon]|nr:protein-L-isoaspartate(D-aspartate) O-methyltransferase [Candidatus Aenigmarchaeota archaeon]